MEWLTRLYGTVVGLDTAPLIYLIEENSTYLPIVLPFFEALDRDEFQVVTSTITLLEVLVHPLRKADTRLAQSYRDILLSAKGVTTVPITADIASEAAKLRAAHDLTTPDAIQLATAARHGASSFLTNDISLPAVSGLSVITLVSLITQENG